MPLQAVPIAMRATVGNPVAKLAFIWLTARCDFEDGEAFVFFEMRDLATFAQCTLSEAADTLVDLERVGLVTRFHDCLGGSWEARLNMPLTAEPMDARRRWSLTPDQKREIVAACFGMCVGCGAEYGYDLAFNFDHIIPRAVGGADVDRNAQILCSECNGRKRARIGHVDFIGEAS